VIILSGIIRSFGRFPLWWLLTFRARGGRGKLLFGVGSLVAACLLCSIPVAIFAPAATPIPAVTGLADSIAPDESEAVETAADEEVAEVGDAQSVAKRTAGRVTAEPATATTEPVPTDTAEPTDRPVPTNTATTVPTRTTQPTATEAPPAVVAVAGLPAGDEAAVTRIIDGDTIDVMMNGEIFRVRYIGMDTPERGMPFFAEATEANRQLVEGQTVILVRDVSETDRYGRLLRYVYLTSGLFVNAELVRLGFAQIATYPPDVAHQAEFLALQQEARENELGLWALPAAGAAVEPVSEPTQPPASAATPAPLPTDAPPPAPAPAAVVISFIYYDGQVARVESDEYAEITNTGGSAVNLAGWRLNAGNPGQDFWFPSFGLQPGQSCRVYTNQIHAEYCGFSFGSGQALWNNRGDCGYLYDASGAEVSRRCY
jgi:endonuclease YncB( thermonuclease family)